MLPRNTPKCSMASIAYSEQVGTYRHDAGSQGEITSLYPRSNHSAMFRAICIFESTWELLTLCPTRLPTMMYAAGGPRVHWRGFSDSFCAITSNARLTSA